MSSTDRVQSVRNAWINCVRDEALRMRRGEVSKCVHVGILIATYADADGGNAFPSAVTIAAIAGCSEETVTRCVRVLMAVGLLRRRRRPNQSSVYQLVIPMERPAWAEHLHLYTDTRQARRKKALKEKELAESSEGRTASQNGVRNPFPMGVPEPVPAGGSGEPGPRSGTGTETVAERVPEPVPAGAYQYIPTCGRDPHPDKDVAELEQQPPVGAGAGADDERVQQEPEQALEQAGEPRPFTRCAVCGIPLLRAGRRICRGCELGAEGVTEQDRQIPVQGAFLASVPSGPTPGLLGAPGAAPWPAEDPSAPLRVCGCSRQYRAQKPGRCRDCLAAEHGQAVNQ